MRVLEYLIYITMFTAFFPLPAYLYVQVLLATVQIMVIVYYVVTHKVSIKDLVNKYSIFLCMLLLYAIFSVIWAKDLLGWAVYSAVLFIGSINSVSLWVSLGNKKVVKNLLKVIMAAVVLQNIVGWFEVITGIYPFAFNIDNISYNRMLRRPITFFKNVNDYATFLLFSLIFVFSYKPKGTLYSKNPLTLKKSFKWLLLLSNFGLIVMVGSRGILLVSVLSIMFMTYLKLKNRTFQKRTFLIGVGIITLLVLLILSTMSIPSLESIEQGDAARVYLIMNGLLYLKDTLFMGVGAGNVSYYLEVQRYFPVGHLRTIHNWWVEFLVMYGVVFFTTYIAFYIKNIFKSLKKYFQTRNQLFLFTTSWAVAFIVGSVISSSLYTTIWIIFIHNLMFIVVEKVKVNETIRSTGYEKY